MSLPNLRRIFADSRSEAEEQAHSRAAFYNLVIFVTSIALAAITAQKMGRDGR